MALHTIPLLGPTQEARDFRVNSQRSINLFASIEKPGAKSSVVLYPTPGLDLVATPTSGSCRSNGVNFLGKEYFVIGSDLVEIADGDVLATYTGVITTSSGRVSFARGTTYLFFVDGADGYYFDGTTLTKVTDGNFPASPTHSTYLDGYFIVNDDGTDDYYISAQDDPSSWAATDTTNVFANITALIATSKDLYLMGSYQTTVATNTSNPDFPFDSYPGGIIDIGIAAPHSLVRTSQGLIMLSANDDEGDAFVVIVRGFQYTVVSDDDMNYQINALDTISDAIGSVYGRHGRTFYVLTFPSSDKTFTLDVSSGLWHTRKSESIGRWRAAGIGYFGNNHYVGDYNSSKLFKMNDATYDEGGDIIERERVCQVLHVNGKRFTTQDVVLDMKTGVGLTTGQGSDPQVMMTYSDDGGNTWSNELWQTPGAIGEYRSRVMWSNLGESFGRIFKFRVTDPVNTVFVAAYANIEVSSD